MDRTDSENLHHLLHDRLATLTKFNSTSSEFKHYFSEDMFKTANPKGFNEVINFLLNIVDKKKCKEKLNMPLLDRKMEQEFRKGVQEFIADINKENTKISILPITASMLQTPFGDKIVRFLLQLCQYVMHTQLHSKLNVSNILQPPLNVNNAKTSSIMMKILKAKIKTGKENIRNMEKEHNLYVSEAVKKSKTLEESVQNLNVHIKKDQAEVETLINRSKVPDHLRMRIESGDSSAFEEWNKIVDQEIDDFEAKVLVLERISSGISDFRNLLADAVEWKKSPPCLDKDRLIKVNISTSKNETLNIPVYNENGELSLEGFFNYGKCLLEDLRDEITKKYPKNESGSDSHVVLKTLIEKTHKLQALKDSLDKKISEMTDSIKSNQSKLYPHYEDYETTLLSKDIFNSPNVNFQENSNTSNIHLGQGDCVQLLRKIKNKCQKKRKLSLLCSIKHKTCYSSTKTYTTRIPSLVKNVSAVKLVTPKVDIPSSSNTQTEIENKNTNSAHVSYVSSKRKVLVYPRSAMKSYRKSGNFLQSNGLLENNMEIPNIQLATPVGKQISIPTKPSTILDFLSDITFTAEEQEIIAQHRSWKQQSGDTSLTGISTNWNTPERLENTSLPAGFESDSSLDLSKSSSGSDNNDQNNFEELKEDCVETFKEEHIETLKEEPIETPKEEHIETPKGRHPNRRDSLQALLNRYKEHKKKFKRLE